MCKKLTNAHTYCIISYYYIYRPSILEYLIVCMPEVSLNSVSSGFCGILLLCIQIANHTDLIFYTDLRPGTFKNGNKNFLKIKFIFLFTYFENRLVYSFFFNLHIPKKKISSIYFSSNSLRQKTPT